MWVVTWLRPLYTLRRSDQIPLAQMGLSGPVPSCSRSHRRVLFPAFGPGYLRPVCGIQTNPANIGGASSGTLPAGRDSDHCSDKVATARMVDRMP